MNTKGTLSSSLALCLCAACGGRTFSIHGEALGFATETPLEQITVCVEEDVCDTTVGGRFHLEAPAGVETTLRFRGADRFPMLLQLPPQELDLDEFRLHMFSRDQIGLAWVLVAGEAPEARLGQILINAIDRPSFSDHAAVAGVTAALTAEHSGPFYGADLADQEQAVGSISFVNVPRGEHVLTLSHADKRCRAAIGWDGTQDGALRALVERDTLTFIAAACN